MWRPLIIPTPNDKSSEIGLNPQPPPQPSTAPAVDAEPAPHSPPSPHHRNYTWAELMKRVFLVDVLQCVSGPSFEAPSIEEIKTIAEKEIRDIWAQDPSILRLETAASDDSWRGHKATRLIWSDPTDYHGLQRHYIVRFVGRDIASLESNYDLPAGYMRADPSGQYSPG